MYKSQTKFKNYKNTKLKCPICLSIFYCFKGEYTRSLKKGYKKYCSITCSSNRKEKNKIQNLIDMKCLNCNNNFSTDKRRPRKCCSNLCARKYSSSFAQTQEHKQLQSSAMKFKWKTDYNYASNQSKLMGKRSKKLWENKEYREKQSNTHKKLWKNVKFLETNLPIIKKRNEKNKIFSSKGEREIVAFFKCKYPQFHWSSGGPIRYNLEIIGRDLYCKELKVCVEYDGIWHFKDICGQLKTKQKKDMLFKQWCDENSYRLLRIKEDVYKNNKVESLKQIENFIFNSRENYIELY